MVMQQQAWTYRCVACGWEKTVSSRSDALMPGEAISQCGKCGKTDLHMASATGVAGALASGVRVLGQVFGR
jgi:predicted SprT family Zn-dependent metalloprotease